MLPGLQTVNLNEFENEDWKRRMFYDVLWSKYNIGHKEQVNYFLDNTNWVAMKHSHLTQILIKFL